MQSKRNATEVARDLANVAGLSPAETFTLYLDTERAWSPAPLVDRLAEYETDALVALMTEVH